MIKTKIIIKELIIIIVIAFCLSLFLQSFVLEARVIPTGSMLPTIQINQRIIVNKYIYRFKIPQRGDIIVFAPPIQTDEDLDYIKRVIGIQGDKIEIKNGMLHINDKIIYEDYIKEQPKYDFGPVIVPTNCLFVLGDNRNQSYDSHAWNKWLTINNVKGKAFFTYWPFQKLGLINTEVTKANINDKL